jgi:hypothetical protein
MDINDNVSVGNLAYGDENYDRQVKSSLVHN